MRKIIIALIASGLYLASCGHSGNGTTDANGNKTNMSGNPNTTPGQPSPPPGATAAPAGPATTIKFEQDLYDFGQIKQGETVEHIFKFTNTGQHDLVISEAHGSCGCTIPYYPKEPIAAGQSGEMKVSFNSTGKQGPQQKTVTLTANTDPAQTVLTIKSDVQVPATK